MSGGIGGSMGGHGVVSGGPQPKKLSDVLGKPKGKKKKAKL